MSQLPVQFSKYHGTGNDFVLVTLEQFERAGLKRLVAQICDRHRGVGADGVIVVEPLADNHARMMIFNRDGSRPQMCGNGVRCVGRFLVEEHGFASEITVLSDAGPRPCVVYLEGDGCEVDVDMGPATLGERVEFASHGRAWNLLSVDMGNPHGVVWADPEQIGMELIDNVGASLNGAGSPYGEGVNVEFTRVLGSNELEVVVYERGVGRTEACGTGACAVAAAAWHDGLAEGDVTVHLPGGPLKIRRVENHVWMRGDAEFVMQGELAAGWLRARTTG